MIRLLTVCSADRNFPQSEGRFSAITTARRSRSYSSLKLSITVSMRDASYSLIYRANTNPPAVISRTSTSETIRNMRQNSGIRFFSEFFTFIPSLPPRESCLSYY